MLAIDPSLIELPLGLAGSFFRSPMPFGPYDPMEEVWPAYQREDVELVVVLVEPQEYLVHAGGDLPALYHRAGMDVIQFPILDFSTPSDVDAFDRTLDRIEAALREGRNVVAHCLAGVGRTGLVAACLAKRLLHLSGVQAIAWVREHIPGAVENRSQEKFVIGRKYE
jgi:protein-tyrosine phosphatase